MGTRVLDELRKCVSRIDDAIGMVEYGDDETAISDARSELQDEIEQLRNLADQLAEEVAV